MKKRLKIVFEIGETAFSCVDTVTRKTGLIGLYGTFPPVPDLFGLNRGLEQARVNNL